MKTKDKLIKRPSMDTKKISENTSDEKLQHETVEKVDKVISIEENPIDITSKNAEIVEAGIQEIAPHSAESLRYFVPSFVNVRSGPGTGFGITGNLNQGSFIPFQPGIGLDRSPTTWNNGWGWVRISGSSGWVAGWPGTGFNNASNGHLFAAHPCRFQARIELPQVNFRTGPGTEYQTSQIGSFLSLPRGVRIDIDYFVARNSLPWSFTIPSRDLTQVWLSFRSIITTDGDMSQGRGWVRADLVEGLPSDLIRVTSPIMGAINPLPASAVVTSPTLNRRSGAGTHTVITGQHRMGDVLSVTRTQRNITEDRIWMSISGGGWVASENTTHVERVTERIFRVNVPHANIRNAPDVSGTTIIGTQPSNTRLRVTHRLRVTGGMDWFRFDQVIEGAITVGWIADINGFIEGEVGSPGIPMPPTNDFPRGWIDSRPVSLRNPDYITGHTSGTHRPFFATRNPSEINQIMVHHTASPTTLTRIDIEAGWRGLGWWNGGYHEMIHADGRVDLCYNPEVITNGAYGQNPMSYHISLVGDFRIGGARPTEMQMEVLLHRIRRIQSRLGVATGRVLGHSERTPTICPGLNMDEVRSRIGGNTTTPPSIEADQAYIDQFLHNLPREVTNIFGFGPPPGMRFLPNIVNQVQKSQEFMLNQKLVGRITFQEVYETSHIDGFNVKDGKIEVFNIDEVKWNFMTALMPHLSINLLQGRLGEFVQNGSAVFTIEPEFPHPVPWLTLKMAIEKKLPSGNKFKYILKFQIRSRLIHWDHAIPEFEFEVLPDEVIVAEQELWDHAHGWAIHHYHEGSLTLLDFLILLGYITITIATIKQRLAIASLSIVVEEIHRQIMELFDRRNLYYYYYA